MHVWYFGGFFTIFRHVRVNKLNAIRDYTRTEMELWGRKKHLFSKYLDHISALLCAINQRNQESAMKSWWTAICCACSKISQVIFHRQYHTDRISLQKSACYQNIIYMCVYTYIATNLPGKWNLRQNHVEGLCASIKDIVVYFLRYTHVRNANGTDISV